MSPNRPSKQKRAAQNRSQRAAREARAANANAPEPSARSTQAPSSPGGGSLLSRLRGGGRRTASSGAAPAATGPRTTGSAGTRGAALRANQPVGYRAALSAVIAAAAALVLSLVALRYPVDAAGDVYTPETLTADWSMTALRAVVEQPALSAADVVATIEDWAPGRSRDTVAKALWPFSVALVFPLLGAGLGFHAVRRRSPSKVVNRALYATLFGAVLTQGLLLLFLPVVLAMGVAMFQVRKAETVAAAAAAAPPGSDEVIDVDEVESVTDADDE